jgi:hypothetical protein
VVLTTGGSSGDTELWLYDEAQRLLAFDNDGGMNRFSRIERLCGDPLPAGRYFVRVGEMGDDETLDSYDLALSVTPCESPPPSSVPIAGTKLKVRDRLGQSDKRQLQFEARDSKVQLPARGSSSDPRSRGAHLIVANPETGEESAVSLPPSGWTWKKKDLTYRSASGPCDKVSVRAGRIQAKCKGRGLGFSLDEPRQGQLIVQIGLGDETSYCTVFGGEIRSNYGIGAGPKRTRGEFDARNAPRPQRCPM